jgi:hypothetical protein
MQYLIASHGVGQMNDDAWSIDFDIPKAGLFDKR